MFEEETTLEKVKTLNTKSTALDTSALAKAGGDLRKAYEDS